MRSSRKTILLVPSGRLIWRFYVRPFRAGNGKKETWSGMFESQGGKAFRGPAEHVHPRIADGAREQDLWDASAGKGCPTSRPRHGIKSEHFALATCVQAVCGVSPGTMSRGATPGHRRTTPAQHENADQGDCV